MGRLLFFGATPYLYPMKRFFVTNLLLLVGLNLLVKPFYLLVIESKVQDSVGAEEFGNYFALINLSFILNILLDLGITNYNNREVAKTGKGNLTSLLLLKFKLAPVYGAAVAGCALLLGYSSDQWVIVFWLVFNQFLASMILFFRSYLSGLHLFKTDSIISVLDRILMIAIIVGLLITHDSFDIMWFVWAQTVSYFITALISLLLLWRRKKEIGLKSDVQEKQLLLDSAPYALMFLISMIVYRIDSVMLERLHPNGAYETGIYAMGFRLFEAFNMLAYLFGVLLVPIFSRLIANNEQVGPIVKIGFRFMLGATGIFAVLCWFNSSDILSLIYENPDSQTALVLNFLSIGCASFSMQYIFGSLLTANGNIKLLIYIASAGAILNIALNFFFIPLWGAQGCAISNAISQTLVLSLQIAYVFRIFQFKFDKILAWKSFVFIVMALTVAWLSSSFFWFNTIFDLGITINLLISAALVSLTALISGLLDFRQIPVLFRMRDKSE